MRRLVRDLFGDVEKARKRLVLAVLFASLASASSVALMGVSGWLISFAALAPPVLFLQPAAVGVRAFGISRGVFRYVERLVGHDVALRMQGALRVRVYDKLARTTLIGRRRGDLLSRVVTDVAAVQDLVVRVLLPVLSASVVVLATTVMLALFNIATALVLLASAVLAGVLLPWWTQRMSLAVDRESVSTRGRLADGARELALTSTDLVAYGAEASEVNRILEIDDELRQQESRGAWVRGVAAGGQIVASGFAVLAALYFGTLAVQAQQLDPRMLAVLVLTPLAMHEILNTFAQAAQTYTKARSSLDRIVEILDAPPIGNGDVTDGDSPVPGLRFEDVTVGWPGSEPVLTGLNLSIAPGEKVALVGPSGVGKTTIAATAMGLIPPMAGELHRGGRVGYLEQDAHIFATTLGENVRIGDREADDDQIADALNRAGLHIDQERMAGEDGAQLSGGERRRLALARLLVGQRSLIILDEPTEHLDRETADALMHDVWAAFTDDPVLVITHDPEVMASCDRIVRLG